MEPNGKLSGVMDSGQNGTNGIRKKSWSRSSIVSFASGDLKSLRNIRVEWTGLNVFTSDDYEGSRTCCKGTGSGPKHILKDGMNACILKH